MRESQPLDEFHIHELLDRAHCINEIFNILIAEHAAANLIQPEIINAQVALSVLYQAAGQIIRK